VKKKHKSSQTKEREQLQVSDVPKQNIFLKERYKMLANCPPSNLHKTLVKDLKECAEFKKLVINSSGSKGKILKKDYIAALAALKKSSKPKKKSTKPSYAQMIIEAIRSEAKPRGGASRYKIKGYIISNYNLDESKVRSQLLKLLKEDNLESLGLIKVNGSYKLSPAKRLEIRKVAKKAVSKKASPKKKVAKEKKPVSKKVVSKEKKEKVVSKEKKEKAVSKEGKGKVVKAKSPVTKTKSPVVKSPVTKQKSPVVKSPVTKPKSPVVKSPVTKPKSPVTKTKSPVTKTKSPVTKKPVTKTKKSQTSTKKKVQKQKKMTAEEYHAYLEWKEPETERVYPMSPSVIRKIPSPASPSVKFYSKPKAIKNQPWLCAKSVKGDKRFNEDRYIAFEFAKNVRFFAVLDGHGGQNKKEENKEYPDAVDFFSKELPVELLKEIKSTYSKSHLSTMKHRIIQAFLKVDKMWFETYPTMTSGSTITAVLDFDVGEGYLYTINLGDSVTYIAHADGTKLFRTKDHEVSDKNEIKRIELAGFKIRKGTEGYSDRIVTDDGRESLNMSRALGDRNFKIFRHSKHGRTYVGHQAPLSPIPDVVKHNRKDVTNFVLVSDGIVNGLDKGDLDETLIKKGCNAIISQVEKETPTDKDNLTVMIVDVKNMA